MRILLIAYDFPPIPSPQALRWAYLARELAAAGNEMHVLAPDVLGYGVGQLPELTASVTVHRCSPGPITAHLMKRQREFHRRRAASAAAQRPDAPTAATTPRPSGVRAAPALNWKGRLFHRFNQMLGWVLYPDLRAEWRGPARRELVRLLDEVAPDIVISSHEPPVSIPLGLFARKRGVTWVADLGDPVLAPYTPRRWRSKALRLERELCENADLVTVASEGALAMLRKRHGLPTERAMVLTQGYDHRFSCSAGTEGVAFEADRLELLYTGSFYSFRRPEVLLRAIADTPGVRLTVATINPAPGLLELAASRPDSFRLLGFIGHLDALHLQRRCDVLVNIANADPVQVPGKVYEYLGATAPILHVGDNPDDAAALLLSEFQAGWSVTADQAKLASLLCELRDAKRAHGSLERPGNTRQRIESSFSWASLAASLDSTFARIASVR